MTSLSIRFAKVGFLILLVLNLIAGCDHRVDDHLSFWLWDLGPIIVLTLWLSSDALLPKGRLSTWVRRSRSLLLRLLALRYTRGRGQQSNQSQTTKFPTTNESSGKIIRHRRR